MLGYGRTRATVWRMVGGRRGRQRCEWRDAESGRGSGERRGGEGGRGVGICSACGSGDLFNQDAKGRMQGPEDTAAISRNVRG